MIRELYARAVAHAVNEGPSQVAEAPDEPDACSECDGACMLIYEGEGRVPCRTCNGRGF
jgi:hypothetical protein